MFIKLSMMDVYTWREAFDFLSPTGDRKKVARISSEMGDRQFSDVCQKWLHEWTKNVQLGPIDLHSQPALPEGELPDNIRDFKEIYISYLDSAVLKFMHRLRTLVLFNSVNLRIFSDHDESSLEATRTTLGHLLPLFTDDGIQTVALNASQLLIFIRNHFPAQFFGIQWIHIDWPVGNNEFTDLFLPWLNTMRSEGRTLLLRLYGNVLELIERIRQEFLNANCTSSFLILMDEWTNPPYEAIPESTTQNVRTSEQFVVRKGRLLSGVRSLFIGRCAAQLDGRKWMEGLMHRDIYPTRRRIIQVQYPTLGPIEEFKQQKVKAHGGVEDTDQQADRKSVV